MTLKQTLLQIGRFVRETLQSDRTPSRRILVACVVVFMVAVGVRLLHWQNNWLTIDNTMNKTAAGYKKEAQFLTSGDLKSFIRGNSVEPDTGMLIHTPGYPIFIAGVNFVAGNSNVTLRLVHIAFGAAATVLVLLIAADLLPMAAAVFAALLSAISPQLSYYSVVLLPDSIIAVPLLIAIYLFVKACKHPNAWMIVGVGVCIGIACWLRANLLLLAPFLCLFVPLLFPRERWLRYMVFLIVAFVITIAPITIRNAIVYKSFIPLSLSTGTNLIEGIADYDRGKRFEMPQYDHEVAAQEAVLYHRPEYAEELYRPDGILRERLRVARAWEVIRANKLWFVGVAARRAGKMLTYEPVSIISAEPSITNSTDTNRAELAWRGEPSNLALNNPELLPLSSDTQILQIQMDGQQSPRELSTIKVQPQSDYLLALPLRAVEGRMVINVIRKDKGKTIASATIPDSIDPAAEKIGELSVLRIPIVNTNADELRVVVANAPNTNASRNTIELGSIELYRLGPAAYLWTKYPRVVVKGLQKFFTTRWMFPLALAGVVLLALARRLDALAIVCAVPVYFIVTHAPIHLELRYVLPINYFWAMLVATSLYFSYAIAGKLLSNVKRSPGNA